jgi:hypothetical protein
MAPGNQQQQAAVAAAAAAVRLPDFHADSLQCWFDCLDSTFATANITQSITKFHWAMSKLPFSLTPTVRPLSLDPTAVADPYRELKELLLQSYGLTDEQRTSKWLDYPMCGSDTRPSVLWDNLTALQPATLKDAQIALFLRKLPRHISAMINTRSFDTTQEMIQRCNALWRPRPPRRPLPPQPQPARGSTPLFGTPRPADPPPRTAARRPAATEPATKRTSAAARPPPGQPRAAATTACVSTTPALATRPTSARGAALTRKTNRLAAGPQFAAAAGPIPA